MQPPPGASAPSPIPAGTRIRFASPNIEEAAGIEVVAAETVDMGIGVECTARIDYDHNRMAEVRSPMPGIVRAVLVDLGDVVAEGQDLFELESVEVGNLQARRQAARERVEAAQSNLDRQQELSESAIASQRDLEVARQEVEEAEAELGAIDQSLEMSGAPRRGSGRFTITAPMAGSIVRREALLGTYAAESEALAVVAETTSMWALIDIPEWDAASVRLGQAVDVTVDGVADQVFAGVITWISPEVDPRTRTVTARAQLHNSEGVLRANQFGRATVHIAAPVGAVTVPSDAVQRLGEASVVFVRTGHGLYEPRLITLGRAQGDRVQIVGAVYAGESVVTTGGYLLRTELSPDSIGSGCCEVEGAGVN
jgi:cobalt-zinc-cadmium efflux system membrane fusion protein